ncbi:MAG: hypothetical protein DMG76_25440 [Acidobacteria bacterium]|nr:MAG: hypothetical protein DMG76_25440 [Acidobacteriota bacterium]
MVVALDKWSFVRFQVYFKSAVLDFDSPPNRLLRGQATEASDTPMGTPKYRLHLTWSAQLACPLPGLEKIRLENSRSGLM